MRAMGWRRKEKETAVPYDRLTERIPKGYVPMLVGSKEEEAERFLVHVKSLNNPCIVALLEMAAQEFGYRQQGILRIPCNAQEFRDMFHVTSKPRWNS